MQQQQLSAWKGWVVYVGILNGNCENFAIGEKTIIVVKARVILHICHSVNIGEQINGGGDV